VTCREHECVGVRESRLLTATFSPLLALFLGPPCLPACPALPAACRTAPSFNPFAPPPPPSLSSLLCCIHGSLSSLYPSLLTPTRDRTDRIDAHTQRQKTLSHCQSFSCQVLQPPLCLTKQSADYVLRFSLSLSLYS
jgi:hypothetical protein